MIFNTFLLLSLLSFVSSVMFSGEQDRRIRQCLLGIRLNWNPTAYSAIRQAILDRKPETSIERDINLRLVHFNEGFVTNDKLVNILLYIFISVHLKESKTLKCPTLHDELQLATAKFVLNEDYDCKIIPKNIFRYLLLFFYRATGLSLTVVPSFKQELKLEFLRNLSKKPHSFPKSLKFFLSNAEDDRQRNTLSLFHAYFSNNDLMTRYTVFDSYYIKRMRNASQEFELFFMEHFLQQLSQVQISRYYQMNGYTLYSDRVFLSSNISNNTQRLKNLLMEKTANIKCKRACIYDLDRKYLDFNHPHLYLLLGSENDRIYQPKMSIESFYEFIDSFSHFDQLNLEQAEAFSHVIRSGVLATQKEIDKALRMIYKNSSSALFEIFVKEIDRPLNIFYEQDTFKLPVFSLGLSETCSDLVMNLLNLNDDPLIFLTMDINLLRLIKKRVTDRYNLNKRYTFNLTLKELKAFGLVGSVFKMLYSHNGKFTVVKLIQRNLFNKTLSFKEIINNLPEALIAEVRSIFSSNPVEFYDLSSVDTINPPVIVDKNTTYNYFNKPIVQEANYEYRFVPAYIVQAEITFSLKEYRSPIICTDSVQSMLIEKYPFLIPYLYMNFTLELKNSFNFMIEYCRIEIYRIRNYPYAEVPTLTLEVTAIFLFLVVMYLFSVISSN